MLTHKFSSLIFPVRHLISVVTSFLGLIREITVFMEANSMCHVHAYYFTNIDQNEGGEPSTLFRNYYFSTAKAGGGSARKLQLYFGFISPNCILLKQFSTVINTASAFWVAWGWFSFNNNLAMDHWSHPNKLAGGYVDSCAVANNTNITCCILLILQISSLNAALLL